LDALPYAEGVSWNPNLVCLSDTRKDLIDDVIKWIDSADESKVAEILWLSDVAGAGKSAIAHTIAQYCEGHGLLGSSFFFDRSIPDRRSPQKLISTIARDLVRLEDSLANHISLVLENDRSLASASQSRQFDKLIVEPSLSHRIGRTVVIVIDALDEGYDLETLEVLRNKVPKLPGTFRVVLTSRPLDGIIAALSGADHIQRRSIDIHSDTNRQDIALYVWDRLRYISSRRGLPPDWPGAERAVGLVIKAEGLFGWVAIVSEYLHTVADPDRTLSTLLSKRNLSGMPVEAKMDALYAEILSTCNWSDEDFLQSYYLHVGAIMAVKSPLSSSALRALHGNNPERGIGEALRPLRSLLTGLFDDEQPILISHLSFREFLTDRAQSYHLHRRFYVSEKEHNQRLASLCLRILNEDLMPHTPGAGYLTRSIPGIPSVHKSQISEALGYACRFWADHIIEIDGPMSGIFLSSLREFLATKCILWMEVLTTRYPFQSLSKVRVWLQVST
jgi:hypothetical protein